MGKCWHGHNYGLWAIGRMAFLPSLFTCVLAVARSFMQITVTTLSRTSVLLSLYVCIQGFATTLTPRQPSQHNLLSLARPKHQPTHDWHGRSVPKLR